MFSSYIGVGEWTITGGILILSDDEKMGYPLVNHFLIDGERFTGTVIAEEK